MRKNELDPTTIPCLVACQEKLHQRILKRVRRALDSQSQEHLAEIKRESTDDTIFALDVYAETDLIEDITELFSPFCELTLVCEGEEAHGGHPIPCSNPENVHTKVTLILDPVDGTRGLLYSKRSAWILSAIAPNMNCKQPTLQQIEIALQTEIPTMRSNLSDQLLAIRGQGVQARTQNLENGTSKKFRPQPTSSPTIKGGFSTVCRFFPPGRKELADLDDVMHQEILGAAPGRALVFEDQYLSTGGQVYQLAMGKDRFVADLRGTLNQYRRDCGKAEALTCHPYDICTFLVATELGVMITMPDGSPLNYPLDTLSQVSWLGFANQEIFEEVYPTLTKLIPQHLRYRDFSPD